MVSNQKLVAVSWRTTRRNKKVPIKQRRTNGVGVISENKSFVVLVSTPSGGEKKVRIRATTPKEAATLARKKVKDSKVLKVFKVEREWSHAWDNWRSGKHGDI